MSSLAQARTIAASLFIPKNGLSSASRNPVLTTP
jgi:hypothetical protein